MRLNPFCFRATAEHAMSNASALKPVSIPFASGLLLNSLEEAIDAGACLNPFCFRATAEPTSRAAKSARPSVSIPFASGLLLNAAVRDLFDGKESQSLLLQGYC